MRTVNILWTGGWDSTFRVLQLSTKDVIIQPYYLRDNWRGAEQREIDNIALLTEIIRVLPSTTSSLCDLIVENSTNLAEDENINGSYKEISQQFKQATNKLFAYQYNYLARFSKNIGIIEIGLEKGTMALDIINTYGAIKKNNDDKIGSYYIVDKSISSNDIVNLFGNYHLPIIDYSKLRMKEEAEENGFIDIMNKTWFCYFPINNKPCGRCNPCNDAIDAGLKYRFTNVALIRNRVRKILDPLYGTLVYRVINKIYRISRNLL